MATQDRKNRTNSTELSSQAVALAEQVGRIAGTIEGTAEAWLNRASLTDQLTKVRDRATQLLNSLAGGASIGRKSTSAAKAKPSSARAASANLNLAHAPGKRHRKPAPTTHGAKHSDERIPKAKATATMRRGRKYAAAGRQLG